MGREEEGRQDVGAVKIDAGDLDGEAAEPHHDAGLTEAGEIRLEQPAPGASAIVPLELLLAAPLVAAAFAPDALHHFCLGIAGAAHQDGEVFIVFAHASGLDRGGVDAETQFGGDEAYEFERSPGTEPAVVLVGTFGRCCSAHEDFPEDEAFVAEDGDDMFPIEGYEGFFLAQLRAIDGELYASRCGVEEGIADLWYDGIAVVADIDEGVFSERLVGADLLRRCLHGVEK